MFNVTLANNVIKGKGIYIYLFQLIKYVNFKTIKNNEIQTLEFKLMNCRQHQHRVTIRHKGVEEQLNNEIFARIIKRLIS